ncbi:hypothetical protein RND71_001260 [Anisodus tanguticus]|uniref:Pentatricopeptide repeat-containing protein n=1 Tax=Anisodus tanguticus TaxID=243964 RepID=A0AAE1T145_9SOLA|nr:hypothetical protein RND71_001260 [Anisodus tanguticus]
MIENGVFVDEYSLSIVLKACSRMGFVKYGMQVHGLLRKLGFGSDVFLQNYLISMYVRCGCVEYGHQVFDRMSMRDSVSYNTMIDGYLKCGMLDVACGLFDFMPREMRNLISWNAMLTGYATALFDMIPKKDVVSWAIMVDGYAKIGKIDIARRYFDDMPERDVISCNAIWLMAELGYIEEGIALHCYIEENGFHVAGKLGVASIDMYAKCGSVDSAMDVFNDIQEKTVDHWNAMIGGVRTIMKERNLKKIVGSSRIELQGIVHEFSVGDKSSYPAHSGELGVPGCPFANSRVEHV